MNALWIKLAWLHWFGFHSLLCLIIGQQAFRFASKKDLWNPRSIKYFTKYLKNCVLKMNGLYHTVFIRKSIPKNPKNILFQILLSSTLKRSKLSKTKIFFQFLWPLLEIIPLICLDKLMDRAWDTFWTKLQNNIFIVLQKKLFDPQKNSKYMVWTFMDAGRQNY